MTVGGTLLLERVTPEVRGTLIRQRIHAMQGNLADALRALDEAIDRIVPGAARDVIALATLKAELLHLDRQDETALDYFQGHVLPLKETLTLDEQFAVEQNLADLEFAMLSPHATVTFYNLVDRRRLAGFELFDAHALLAAQEAASAGKHYDALPIIWQQVVRAHLQGCWLATRWATTQLAAESFQLGALVQAGYYSVVAPTDELVEKVAGGCLVSRDSAIIKALLSRLIGAANLRIHFSIACRILTRLGDAIPDDDLPELWRWLRSRCSELPDGRGAGAMNTAWETVEAVAHRFPPPLAREVTQAAVTHPAWTTALNNPDAIISERRQLVSAVNQLTVAIPSADLGWLAQQAIPLALTRRQLHDYGDVVNLLCHLADRGGAAVKEEIAGALLPAGKPVDRMLIQVAPLLRSDPVAPEGVAALAEQVASEIERQVEVLPLDHAPVPLPETVITLTAECNGQKRVTYLVGGVGLHAVAKHRHALSAEMMRRVVNVVLKMAAERENFIANRVALLMGLLEFADQVDAVTRRAICSAVQPIARGEIQEPTGQPTAAETANPLNPIKLSFGSPDQLQSVAIVVLGEFAGRDHELIRPAADVLEDSLYHQNPEIRRGVFAGVGRLPEVTEPLLLGVLMGTRDSDPNVAASAFFALTQQPGWGLTRSLWHAFLQTLRLAVRAPETNVRRNAAAAASAWAGKAPNNKVKKALDSIQDVFRADICASVREQVPPRGAD